MTRSTVTAAAVAISSEVALVSPAAAAARTSGAPRVVPQGVPVSTAAAAAHAGERLADCLTGAATAAAALIVSRYGADIDRAAVALAKRAADELSGAAKSRGGARADVLSVLSVIESHDTPVSDVSLVAAARVRLDANAAAKRDRRATKNALADTVNNSAAPMAERAAALSVLAGMDEADAGAKRATARDKFAAACAAAIKSGLTREDLLSIIGE